MPSFHDNLNAHLVALLPAQHNNLADSSLSRSWNPSAALDHLAITPHGLPINEIHEKRYDYAQ